MHIAKAISSIFYTTYKVWTWWRGLEDHQRLGLCAWDIVICHLHPNYTDIIFSTAIQKSDTFFFWQHSQHRSCHSSNGPTPQHTQPSDKEDVSSINPHQHETSAEKNESILLENRSLISIQNCNGWCNGFGFLTSANHFQCSFTPGPQTGIFSAAWMGWRVDWHGRESSLGGICRQLPEQGGNFRE